MPGEPWSHTENCIDCYCDRSRELANLKFKRPRVGNDWGRCCWWWKWWEKGNNNITFQGSPSLGRVWIWEHESLFRSKVVRSFLTGWGLTMEGSAVIIFSSKCIPPSPLLDLSRGSHLFHVGISPPLLSSSCCPDGASNCCCIWKNMLILGIWHGLTLDWNLFYVFCRMNFLQIDALKQSLNFHGFCPPSTRLKETWEVAKFPDRCRVGGCNFLQYILSFSPVLTVHHSFHHSKYQNFLRP